MSDLSNQAQKLLGRFSKTVDAMRSAYSKSDKMMMSVWADDLYAVQAVMSFLETIRDAPAQSGQMTAKEAIDIGAQIADVHDTMLQEMAKHFYPEIPVDRLAKLIHGNKVALAAEIMRELMKAQSSWPSPGAHAHKTDGGDE